jgi:L-threonylcarbamoyladenylate synthase
MENFETDITQSLEVLRAGGIILYPTDTIWGIGCDATNIVAIKRIYNLKKREEKKSMIILVVHEEDIDNYVLNPSKKLMDFLSGQNNPTTAIFGEARNLPENIINEDGSIAIRIVQDDFCSKLIQQLSKPIISTSANVSGTDSPKNFSEIPNVIKDGVDYIVHHRQHELKKHQPSSIVRLGREGELEMLR